MEPEGATPSSSTLTLMAREQIEFGDYVFGLSKPRVVAPKQ